jgi:hypothetical protein
MGEVSASSRSNNREFLEFFGEKQASDGLIAAGAAKFAHCPRGLGTHPGRSCYFAKQAIKARKQAI